MNIQILNGDCTKILQTLPARSFNTCVTSPPYYGLRDYGVKGQIGIEDTPDAFVARLVEVFRAVHRVLRDDGTLWLNLGDSYAGSWGNYGGQNRGKGNSQREITVGSSAISGAYKGKEKWRPPTSNKMAGLKPKDLIGIPWRVAFALQADGWYLRQDIIWAKPNPMPESVSDRCTKAHEYIFLLSKGARYHFDAGAVREAAVNTRMPNRKTKETDHYGANNGGNAGLAGAMTTHHETGLPAYRNRRSVWTVTTKPFKGAHFATFPPELIEPCILAGSPIGGSVLDPFGGAGTTGLVANRLQRNATLIELNPEYAQMARSRIGDDSPLFANASVTDAVGASTFEARRSALEAIGEKEE